MKALPHHRPSVGGGRRGPYRDSLEGPELQVSEVLSQLPRLQVVKNQGHFALFAQAWAAHGGWGARATLAQAGGKEGQGIGGAQVGGCWAYGEKWQNGSGREQDGGDSQIVGIS